VRYWLVVLFLVPIFAVQTAKAQSVDSLIASLSDPNPDTRQQAEQQLLKIGAEARPALIEASRGARPAVASAAARILMALPWYRPDDPPGITALLRVYGTADIPGRIALISRIAREPLDVGWPVLVRLIMEDPNEDVCWNIVTQLHGIPQRRAEELNQLIRDLHPSDSRPAALTLVARAWEAKDRPRALALYRRAIDAETQRPSYDDGELDTAYDALVGDAIKHQQFDDAASLRRSQTSRIGVTRTTYPAPVYALFLLHANYGPLKGFDRDLQEFAQYLGHPQVLYCLARTYERAGRLVESLALRDAARTATFSADEHAMLARTLGLTDWNDYARLEAMAALDSTDPDTLEARIKARLLLAEFAGQEDNDAAVVEHLTKAVDLTDGIGPYILTNPTSVKAQIEWRSARLAQAKGDQAAFTQHLQDAVDIATRGRGDASAGSDTVLNLFPLLKSAGQSDKAIDLFNRAYNAERRDLEAASEDVKPELMNNLAWLCARCDQKLDEALELSKQAVAAQPDNAAYIDTLAEIHFRRGDAAEAARLEAQALRFKPDDEFMQRQLLRFKSGK
jgi:tetratricopeptide (TPR) repeat protein